MANWIRFQLSEGSFEGQRLISEAAMDEMNTPQTIIPLEGYNATLHPGTHFLTYGLAWEIHDYLGKKVVRHGGGIDGMHSIVAFLPEENLGMVVLTNTTGSFLPQALLYRLMDIYLNAPERDWSAEIKKVYDALIDAGKAETKKVKKARVKRTKPSLPLDAYTGQYENRMYGNAIITRNKKRLQIRQGPAFAGPLDHWNYNTFRVTWTDPTQEPTFISFNIDAQGKVDSLDYKKLGTFRRVVDRDSISN